MAQLPNRPSSKILTLAAVLCIALIMAFTGCGDSKKNSRLSFPFAKTATTKESTQDTTMSSRVKLPTDRVNAPDFPTEFAWVNTDRPLSIKKDLAGCVVVLDFWTYCCINCMHILPDLEFLEHKYADKPFVVVGVHSAKFDNESDDENINQACQRYNIAHPVIVDQDHKIWSDYSVRSWPTLMVIDPEGKVVGSLPGEGNREILDNVISALLEEGKAKNSLAAAAPKIERKSRVPAASGLAFPGKVLAEPSGKLLFISDSNHHRIIIATPDGQVRDIAGSGERSFRDGDFSTASFSNPQGLAYDGENFLYVADTDNHAIRKLDLAKRTIETIAGTGEQVYDRSGGKKGRAQGLNSPWDLVLANNKLYIAMAGPHQLWTLDLNSQICEAWAGSGREDIADGTGLFAALAQPSGLAQKGDWLYFVDSEVSALRRVNIKNQNVETLIGSGLFDFGYRDGDFRSAQLQHPLGVTISGDDILVADTYNHRIRLADERTRKLRTVCGTGQVEAIPSSSGPLSLYEPGGLSALGDALYIADTNHDRIVKYNLKTAEWSELQLKGLHSMSASMAVAGQSIPLKEVDYRAGSVVTLRLSAEFPRGYHLNRDAPINYSVTAAGVFDAPLEGLAKSAMLPVEIQLDPSKISTGSPYDVMLSIAYCTDGNSGLCIPATLAWKLKFTENASASNQIDLTAKVEPPPN